MGRYGLYNEDRGHFRTGRGCFSDLLCPLMLPIGWLMHLASVSLHMTLSRQVLNTCSNAAMPDNIISVS